MTVLHIRDKELSARVAERIRQAARVRGWTIGKYLTQVLALHDSLRVAADNGDREVQAILAELGLETQSE